MRPGPLPQGRLSLNGQRELDEESGAQHSRWGWDVQRPWGSPQRGLYPSGGETEVGATEKGIHILRSQKVTEIVSRAVTQTWALEDASGCRGDDELGGEGAAATGAGKE